MQTECSADLFGFARGEGGGVVVGFGGGRMGSDAGAMLLGATDGAIGLVERFAGCFTDHRAAELIEHTVAGLVRQRVVGIALGYEDLIDHDQLRHDPVMAVASPRHPRSSCRRQTRPPPRALPRVKSQIDPRHTPPASGSPCPWDKLLSQNDFPKSRGPMHPPL